MICSICGGPNTAERAAIGYDHCTNPDCVATWRMGRIRAADLHLVAAHKQGLMWVRGELEDDGRRH